MFKIFHTNNTDFIIQLIHESVIFIDKYDASCAFFNIIVGQLNHLVRLAASLMSYQ